MFGTDVRPRVRDHYRAHKLSTWLNLIPQLESIPYDDDTLETTIDRGYSTRNVSTTSSTPLQETDSTYSTTNTVEKNTTGDDDFVYSSRGEEGHTPYTTALSLTIIVGCGLLVLNMLSFAGMYYQHRRFRKEYTNNSKSIQHNNTDTKDSPITPSFYHHHHQVNTIL